MVQDGPDYIYNLDETSTTTLQKRQHVIALECRRNVGNVTSKEWGILIITCCIVSTSGIPSPPVMVFPRKTFKNYMIIFTLGLVAPRGWMNVEIFSEVMKHIKSTLILHLKTYLSIQALDSAKTAGMHVLPWHPHYHPNLGKPLTIYDIGEIAGKAFLKTLINTMNAFEMWIFFRLIEICLLMETLCQAQWRIARGRKINKGHIS